MGYSSEEWGWVEAEWAFHCHGRTAFMSPEDFLQAQAWEEEGVPPEVVVEAMAGFFGRLAKRPRPRRFVAFSHLKKDIAKALSFRNALNRAGDALGDGLPTWDSAKNPLKSDPRARAAFEGWMRIRGRAPTPESPGYLDHLDSDRAACREFVAIAADALGPALKDLKEGLAEKLRSVEITEGSAVWRRAWDYHYSKAVCDAWGFEGMWG